MGIDKKLAIVFNEGVKRYFQPIAEQYSCRFEKIDDLIFHLTRNNYFVKIRFYGSHEPDIVVTIHPNRKIYKRLGADLYGLGFIASALLPNPDFGPERFHTERQVLSSLEKQSKLLVECCDKMLKGDFSQWRQLNKILKIEREKREKREEMMKKNKFEPNTGSKYLDIEIPYIEKRTGISIRDKFK